MANFIPPLPLGQFAPSSETMASWLYQVWQYLQNHPIPDSSEIEVNVNEIIEQAVPPLIQTAIDGLDYAHFVDGSTLPVYRAANDEIDNQDLLEAWNEGCRFALVDDEAFYIMIKNGETITLLQVLTQQQASSVISVNGQTGVVVIPNATTLMPGLMSNDDKIVLDTLKTNPLIPFGVCSTAADVAAKTVTVSPAITSLREGQTIYIKFEHTDTAASPTLNVNGLGAKPIYRYGTFTTSGGQSWTWHDGQVILFRYNGSAWLQINQPLSTEVTYNDAGLMPYQDKIKLDGLHLANIRIGYVQVNNVSGSGPWAINASLNAGETFISWVGISSNGWIGAAYIAESSNPQTLAWSGIAADGNNTYILAYYLAGTFV